MKVIVSIIMFSLLFPLTIAGCSQSSNLEEIIQYPGAVADQEHNAKVLGFSLARVKREVTDDSYDEVLAYYKKVLESYNPEIASYTLEDGRQAAITVSSITIGIQEFKKEAKTAITFME